MKSRIDTYSHLLKEELYREAQTLYGDGYQDYLKIGEISILYTEWYNVNPWDWIYVVKYEIPNEVKLYKLGGQNAGGNTNKLFTEVTGWDND